MFHSTSPSSSIQASREIENVGNMMYGLLLYYFHYIFECHLTHSALHELYIIYIKFLTIFIIINLIKVVVFQFIVNE